MTQKHVDLLLKAIAVPESCSIYLCDRIRYITARFCDFPEYIDWQYSNGFGQELCDMIKENINYEFSFDDTQYAKDGMTREQWVKTILVPLALQLP